MNELFELLGAVGYAADTPGALLRGALGGRLGERMSGRDLLTAWGAPQNNPHEWELLDLLGGGIDLAIDPMNALGVGWLGKTAKVAKAADKSNDIRRAMLAKNAMPEEIAELTKVASPTYRVIPGMEQKLGRDFRDLMPALSSTGHLDDLGNVTDADAIRQTVELFNRGGLPGPVGKRMEDLLGRYLERGQAPTRMYHGTGSVFDKHDPTKWDKNALWGPGGYHSDAGEIASEYAENYLDDTIVDFTDPKSAIEKVREYYRTSQSGLDADNKFIEAVMADDNIALQTAQDWIIESMRNGTEYDGSRLLEGMFRVGTSPANVRMQFLDSRNPLRPDNPLSASEARSIFGVNEFKGLIDNNRRLPKEFGDAVVKDVESMIPEDIATLLSGMSTENKDFVLDYFLPMRNAAERLFRGNDRDHVISALRNGMMRIYGDDLTNSLYPRAPDIVDSIHAKLPSIQQVYESAMPTTGNINAFAIMDLFKDPSEWTNALRRAGYDSINHMGGRIMGNKDHDVWIALDPSQVYAPYIAPRLQKSPSLAPPLAALLGYNAAQGMPQ